MSTESAIVVIGMGNPLRRDDGVGVLVARQAAARVEPGVEVRIQTGGGLSLMDAWQGMSAAVVVDAVSSGAAPGTVSRFDAGARPLPEQLDATGSTHDLGLGRAVELARAMGRLPERLVVIGVEGDDFGLGSGLSGPVEAAVDRAVDAVVREVARLTAPGGRPREARHA